MDYRGQRRVTARQPRFVWTVGRDELDREIAVQYDVTEEIIASGPVKRSDPRSAFTAQADLPAACGGPGQPPAASSTQPTLVRATQVSDELSR